MAEKIKLKVLLGIGWSSLIVFFLAIITTGVGLGLETEPYPRLIGRGCVGAGGDLWAMEESDFPSTCAIIYEAK